MKKLLKFAFLGLLFFSFSCGEKAKSELAARAEEPVKEELPPGNLQEERAALQADNTQPAVVLNGRYRKIIKEKPAADCNCNCIDIDLEKPSEWCIVKDKVYISAQCRKSGENSVDIFLVGVSRENSPDRPMPWKDFDIDKPIASITFQPNGDADLDWKGFSINGKIATDYAIFGKKTLEGTYKKD